MEKMRAGQVHDTCTDGPVYDRGNSSRTENIAHYYGNQIKDATWEGYVAQCQFQLENLKGTMDVKITLK